MRALAAILLTGLLLTTVLTTPAAALDEPSDGSSDRPHLSLDNVKQVWSENDVDPYAQAQLQRKIAAGLETDASRGADPVSIETIPAKAGFSRELHRYADGSIAISGKEIPQPEGSISPMHVGGCTTSAVTGGAKYSNCEVYTWVDNWSLSFTATYSILGGYDRINSVCCWAYSVSSAQWTNVGNSLLVNQYYENSSTSANARYTALLKDSFGSVKPKWVQLNVGGNSATETHGG